MDDIPVMPLPQKIRMAYVTSPRELFGEGVGHDERIVPTLEFLHSLTQAHPEFSNIEIAAVFVDDAGREHNRQQLPQAHATFNYLQDFCNQHGITFHVEESSVWREMPLYAERGGRRTKNADKHGAKAVYEEKMLSFMRQNSIDMVFSDSYAVLFNSVMLDPDLGYRGLIINIHPGIANEVPGILPTRDSLARANFFTSDPEEKRQICSSLAFEGDFISVRRNGYDSSIKKVLGKMGVEFEFDEYAVRIRRQENIFRSTTGATLHIVDEMVDHGPVILMSSGTPIRENDTEQELRIRNYGTKNNVVMRGLPIFLRRREVRELIAQNRIRNHAFNGEKLPQFGCLSPKASHNNHFAKQMVLRR